MGAPFFWWEVKVQQIATFSTLPFLFKAQNAVAMIHKRDSKLIEKSVA